MISYSPEVLEAIVVSQDRFVWEAPSFAKYERSTRWYVIMAIVTLFLVAYAVYTANFIFAFIILLMAIILLMTNNEIPKQTLAQVGDLGIVWEGRFYPFQDFMKFGVVYQPPVVKFLHLQHKSSFASRMRIPLEDQDPLALRDHVRQYIKEDPALQEESLSDILGRLLKI